MPTYVTLFRFTDQGAKDIKTLPERARATQAAAEQQGFKVLAWYMTQGRYDVVTIVEAPDEISAAAGTLSIGGRGNFHTETLRAFSLAETEQIIQKMS